ncbi:MAG: hypothetical protein QF420_05075 [Alphaproteobacteria bacterium]|nr:hypothetical protein [Alphaproteobacteria bacterium]
MTAIVFLHRIDTNLVDTGFKYKLDEFDWRKRAKVCSSFLVGPKQNLLDVTRTALSEPYIVDK